MRVPVLAGLCLLLPGLALALDDSELALAYGDAATISIATGSQQRLRHAPAVASVISADDIRAMGARDLDEVLASVPGLHVGRSYVHGMPLYGMRGILTQFTPQILLLQNGVPLTTLFVGNIGLGWGGLPLEQIERIEVMRGPGSALYGADAFSGVINLITKTAADQQGSQLGLRVGSFAGRDAWLLHGRQGSQGLQWLVYARSGRSDGHRGEVGADQQTVFDGIFGSQASLAPGRLATQSRSQDLHLDLGGDGWRLRSSWKQRDLGSHAGVAQALDPQGRLRTQRWLNDLSWQQAQLGEGWGAGASLSHLSYRQLYHRPLQILPPGLSLPTGSFPEGMLGAPFTWERQLRASAYLLYSGWSAHQLRIGLGAEDLDLYRTRELKNFDFAPSGLPIPLPAVTDHSDSDPFMRPQRRRVVYAYVQDDWRMAPDWRLTAGLRSDHFSDFGATHNPRLALVWDARHDLTLKLLAARAFRAPAFTELHSITNPVARGNPALKPETISTAELALVWQADSALQLGANLFSYRMRELIRATPNSVPGTGTSFNNVGSQRGQGLELEWQWQAGPQLRLSGNSAWQRGREAGQTAAFAPQLQLYLRADWQSGDGWRAGAQFKRVAQRARSAGDPRAALPDDDSLDLSLRKRWVDWELSLSLLNALDARRREAAIPPGSLADDLPLPGRSLSLELSWRL